MTEPLPFLKMHGLGNDFVVLDARAQALELSPETARRIADRHRGVGCDQLLILEPARNGGDLYLKILNADGGEVGACGNGTRCVARLLFEETGRVEAKIETRAGLLTGLDSDGLVTVDMGPANLGWQEIPLARELDTLHLDYAKGPLSDPVAVNIGNPHVLFFVADAEAMDLETLGPQIETDPLFPERVNVGLVQHLGGDRLRYRVWERGVGITIACGSGACAAGVAAARRGLTGRRVRVTLDGGDLRIDWRDDTHVLMTGPASKSFAGTLAPELLG
ncbi:diaminopimelate epimerase [Algihabitans albus]|uniref:diaminopimelate epimerase n=1 Tax=Algihabitans albus TaxID=2164067 RepID=UPI000E5D5D7D|nr:diaminopimelate epimerase [Algihabitans albus]